MNMIEHEIHTVFTHRYTNIKVTNFMEGREKYSKLATQTIDVKFPAQADFMAQLQTLILIMLIRCFLCNEELLPVLVWALGCFRWDRFCF